MEPERISANSSTNSENDLSLNGSFDSSVEEEEEVTVDNEEKCQSLYCLNLQEYSPLTHLLGLIPAKAQRGFESYNLVFTCIDAAPDFLAIGTNIGTLFLYDRRDGTLERIRYENYIGTITALSSATQENYLLSFGFDNGVIVIVKVLLSSSSIEISNRINVVDEHHSAITSLEWGTDLVELYSGDKNGLVVHTAIDFTKNRVSCSPLLGEPYEIIQLSCTSRMLAVSTTMRTVVCQLIEDKGLRCQRIQVGKKERKRPGTFGAVFDPSSRNFKLPILYTSRPGTRLWKADSSGKVIETMLLNESLQKLSNETIHLLQSTTKLGIHRVHSRRKPQIEKLRMFQNLLVLAWNSDGIFIIDPDIRVMVACCQGLQRLIDVAVSRDEIFFLQGDRYIRRVGTCPEDVLYPGRIIKAVPPEEFFALSNLLSPFQELASSLKGTPVNAANVQEKNKEQKTDSPIPGFSWLKEKLKKPEGTTDMGLVCDLPPIVNLQFQGPVEIGLEINEKLNCLGGPQGKENSQNLVLSRGTSVTLQSALDVEVSEELVYQPKRKKKLRGTRKISADTPSSEILIETGMTELRLINTATTIRASRASVSEDSDLVQSTECPSNESVPTSDLDTLDGAIARSSSPICNNRPLQTEVFQNNENDDERLAKILSLYSRSQLGSSDRLDCDDTDSASMIQLNLEVNADQVLNNIPSTTKNANTVIPKDSPTNIQDDFLVRERHDPDPDFYRLAWQVSQLSSCEPPTPDVDIYSQKNNFTSEYNSLSQLDSEPISDTISSISITKEDINVSFDNWIRQSTPGAIVSLSLSKTVLYVTNNKEELFYSTLKGPVLVWKNGNIQAQEVFVSPSGRCLSVLCKGNLKYTILSDSGKPSRLYSDLAKNVINASLDDDRAWYITNEGKCFYHEWQEFTKSYSGPQFLPMQFTPKKLAARLGVFWVLLDSGKIYCRTGLSASNPNGLDWVEVPFKKEDVPCQVMLGGDHTAWIIDADNCVWVKKGVERSCPIGSSDWYQVEMEAYLLGEPESNSQKIKTKLLLSADKLGGVFSSHAKLCLASNDKGCFFNDAVDSHLLSSRGDVIAHSWSHFQPNGSIALCKWALISASILATIEDLIWAVHYTGELFCINSSELIAVPLPPNRNLGFKIVSLAPINDMIWVVMKDGSIYVRDKVIPARPQGLYWTLYQDFQLSDIKLVHISCSKNVIWACDDKGAVRCRVGPVRKPGAIEQAWILIDEIDYVKVSGMTKVWVSPSSTMVWAIQSSGAIYVRNAVSLDILIGTDWILVPGLLATDLSLSGTTVWAISEKGEVYFRYGIEASNPSGDAWIRIPGSFQAITATRGNRLWALDREGILHNHETVTVSYAAEGSIHAVMKDSCLALEVEEDWEVV